MAVIEWNVVTAITSVCIALVSLAFTFWQSAHIRKHNKLAVKPLITSQLKRAYSQGQYTLELSNCGFGPAKIDKFDLFISNENMTGIGLEKFTEKLEILFEGKTKFELHYLSNRAVLTPKETITILDINPIRDIPFSQKEADNKLSKIRMEISFSSLYEESFNYRAIF